MPATLTIYDDALTNGFQDYSWATSVDYQDTSPVHSGMYSIGVTAASYTALWLYHDAFDTSPYASLSFWINGGPGGAQGLQVAGVVNQTAASGYNLPALPANTWTQFIVPLSALGVADVSDCQGVWFWPTLAGTTTFVVNSIQLNGATNAPPPFLDIISGTPKSGSFVLRLSGVPGQAYWMQTSTNLADWTYVSTNVLATSSANVTNRVSSGSRRQFWRVVSPP